MDILHIKLVSAKYKVVIYFVYIAAHTNPETKFTAMLWRRLCKKRLFTRVPLKKEINLC